MKTDRELLELAANASGLDLYYSMSTAPSFLDRDAVRPWNPLTDDGDALRLAVKLRLRICTPTTDTDCALASNGDVTAYSEDELEKITVTDLYEATRRAIVRAAAAIGETM